MPAILLCLDPALLLKEWIMLNYFVIANQSDCFKYQDQQVRTIIYAQTTQESHTDPRENWANVGNTGTLRQSEFMANGLQSCNSRQDLLVYFVSPEIGMKYSTIFSTGKKLIGWTRLYTKLEGKKTHAWERAKKIHIESCNAFVEWDIKPYRWST